MTESILQWNLRGFNAQNEGLRRLVADYHPLGICLQETKVRPGCTPQIAGYVSYGNEIQPAPGGRAHGGVAILIRQNLKSARLPLNSILQAVAVRLQTPLQVTLVNIYLPDIHWRRSDLEQLLAQLPQPVLLVGDFNSHNTWWGSSSTDVRGRALEELIDDVNYILLNNGAYTHFNVYSGTFSSIDLSFASPAIAPRFEWTPVNELYQSDHYPIIIKCSFARGQYVTPKRYNLKRADWPAFSAEIEIPPLTGDVNVDVNKFTKEIVRAAEQTVPRKGGMMLRPPVPWWNTECKAANAEKKRAYNRFIRYPTGENLETFKRRRARERYVFKKAKRETLTSYISTISTSTNAKEVWEKIKSLSGGRRAPLVPALLRGTVIVTEPDEVAETLAQHYAQVSGSSSYTNRFLEIKNEKEQQSLNFDTAIQEDYNASLTYEEFEHVLKKVGNTTPGIDGIPYEMIKNLPDAAKLHLLRLYNRIWETGVYPDGWRNALMVPILKEGKDPSNPSSYRPISLTTCLSKVLEAIINERLVYVLENRGLYSQYQAGFRKFHSTLDQLSQLEVYIQDAFMRREHVLAMFFDLEKAYDTVWRQGVLRKCHNWGLRGNLPRFIQSFLDTRRFQVRVGSNVSTVYTQENGIPQGSVLSVTLFGIAVNNIADSVREPIRKSLYVDDLAIYLTGKDIAEIGVSLQTAINDIAIEAEQNGFTFSLSKSKCMHFCRLRKEHNVPILYLKGSPISYNETVKFLGLVFDSKLSWREHIKQTSVRGKKTLKLLKFLASYRWNLDRKTLLQIFTTVTRSKLEYAAPIYSSARKSYLKEIDRIYNQGIRIVTGAFRTSPLMSLYVEAGLLPPELRREQLTLDYMAALWGKQNHFLYPILFDNDDQVDYSQQRTRTRPVNVRAKEIMDAEGAELIPVLGWDFSPTPPWIIPSASVRVDLAILKKEETPPIVYRIKFQQILDNFRNYRPLYTDGSKIHNSVGCAVYLEGVTHSWTLPSYTSIYTAELYAICQALTLCCNEETRCFLICTDSLSALTALRDKFSMDPMVIKIYQLLCELRTNGKEVTFVWVPGHVGIPGNERADQAAKQAAENVPVEVISVRPSDIKNYLKSCIFTKWQRLWDSTHDKLKAIKPLVRPGPVENLPRRDRVILTRLRIGHTRVTHGYLLIKKRNPKCPLCRERLSVTHVLEECQNLQNYRENAGLTHDLRVSLKEGSVTEGLFRYLKYINLYYKI